MIVPLVTVGTTIVKSVWEPPPDVAMLAILRLYTAGVTPTVLKVTCANRPLAETVLVAVVVVALTLSVGGGFGLPCPRRRMDIL